MPPVKPEHRTIPLEPAEGARVSSSAPLALKFETDANYIWLALRDGYVCVVENWTPQSPLRTRVYRYNARLPRDMRVKIAAQKVPQDVTRDQDGFDNIYLVAAGLTLGVARARIRDWINAWAAGHKTKS